MRSAESSWARADGAIAPLSVEPVSFSYFDDTERVPGNTRRLRTCEPQAVSRKRRFKPSGEPDHDVKELRDADAEYHRLCIDVQEPLVALDELRLDEMATAVDRLASTIARLREWQR